MNTTNNAVPIIGVWALNHIGSSIATKEGEEVGIIHGGTHDEETVDRRLRRMKWIMVRICWCPQSAN